MDLYDNVDPSTAASCSFTDFSGFESCDLKGCTPLLKMLETTVQIQIHQEAVIKEDLTGLDTTQMRYVISKLKEKIPEAPGVALRSVEILYGMKEAECRQCWLTVQQMNVKLSATTGNEVIHIALPNRCTSFWLSFFIEKEMSVFSPPGQLLGCVRQDWGILRTYFSILNSRGDPVLRIRGPLTLWYFGDVEFEIFNIDSTTKIGNICKHWTGGDEDNIVVSYPGEADVEIKALIIGACFLIDFMFFKAHSQGEEDFSSGLCSRCGPT